MNIQVDTSSHAVPATHTERAADATPYVHPATTVAHDNLLPLFDVQTETTTNRLNLVGELDYAGRQRFRDVSGANLTGDLAEVVVDLAQLRFIDASGIGLLVEFHNELAARGATLLIVNASTRIARVFSLCGLKAMLTSTGSGVGIDSAPRPGSSLVTWSLPEIRA
jgi:anti-sigma B factor antagonist